MTFVDSGGDAAGAGGDLSTTIDGLRSSTNGLGISATAFANAMTKAFTQATVGGKQLDDVLKSLALRLSNLAVQQAFKSLAKDLAGGLSDIFKTIFSGGWGTVGGQGGSPFISPFADGGIIRTPSYFPLAGGFGLAGEAGPEAIMPLARASDGSLGVAMAGSPAPANVTVQIATPDIGSFRRSEAYLTGQIARAVTRGQRSF
jgi:phage-related minor tail protein